MPRQNERERIRKVYPSETGRAAHLFDGWDETMIWSCLQGVMGSVYVPAGKEILSAAVQLNDFCFLAGVPDADLITFDYGKDYLILTPQNEAWAKLIEQTTGAHRQTRYALRKDQNNFDPEKLQGIVDSLPREYALHLIDHDLYEMCRAEDWCRDLVSGFPDWDSFCKLGLGVVVTRNGSIVSGASSYSRFAGGIEIEIDTHPAHRRRGLARICGAALIVECLRRRLYPSWDAHNRASVSLAQQLGYLFSHEYPVFVIER